MKKLILVLLVVGIYSCKKDVQIDGHKGYCRIENGIGIWINEHDSLTSEDLIKEIEYCHENNGKWLTKTDSAGFHPKL